MPGQHVDADGCAPLSLSESDDLPPGNKYGEAVSLQSSLNGRRGVEGFHALPHRWIRLVGNALDV
jgi:hypothetical protein